MLTVAWCAALLAYAAIWQASVQIGISTWWLGPRAQPTNPAIKMLPFALALTVAVSVIYDVRRPIRVSAAGILAAVAIGLPDFTRSTGLALAELLIPASLALVTAAAMTGQYRLRTPHAPLPTDLVATSAEAAPWAPPIS
jgi:hypothetical protein